MCCQLQPANEDPPIDRVCLPHPTIDEFLGNPQVPHPGFNHIGHFSLPRGRSAALYHEPVVLRLNLLFHSLRSAPPVRGDTLKRLPLYSLASGVIVAIVLMVVAVSGAPIPNIGLGALGLLPLAAALVDAVRLKTKFASGGPIRDNGAGQGGAGQTTPRSELGEWLEEKAEALAAQEQELNARSLSLQQWLQFPDAIDFKTTDFRNTDPRRRSPPSDTPEISADDPMARHDRELLELIEAKTRELFDSIKQDAYRKDSGDRKLFDNEKIRTDLVALVSDVVAIYRPGETAPLLKTNVDAVSRAVGRASLRLLVAVESLPGGLANYDFQSIYNVVMRAVKTFGMYKSAKPYIDVASSVLFAGRIVSRARPWFSSGSNSGAMTAESVLKSTASATRT